MKKYLVIGNPIKHSLSPKLHNYWIKQNNLNATYDKKLVNNEKIKEIIEDLKNEKVYGINVTVPFKKAVIPFLNKLTSTALETDSVNTIFKKGNQIIGDNTDVDGFRLALNHINFDMKGKSALILGAGGVAPSIISALNKLGTSNIFLSNRTKEKAETLRKKYRELKIINWGDSISSDVIINATSLGLNSNDEINLDYSKIGIRKLFYDVIYNPPQTKFLSKAKETNHNIENGKMMFIYQAHQAFTLWHKKMPEINDEVLNIVSND